tara:strand:+ start:1612 stop:2208 length:597 start_codon:yes stop_codon:yes gene_type:complete
MDIKKLYNDKLEQFGESDFRSLNWGDKEGKSAKARYQQMFNYYNWSTKNILEIGCGWGSFFDFGFVCQEYVGVDINENFINLARKKHPKKLWTTKYPNQEFFRNRNSHYFDVCISSGVAGNREGPAWNPNLLKNFLNQMFNISKTVIVNFPSNRADIRSEHVEYFSPEYILGEALNITHNVQLIHQTKSDFLLILNHE